MLLEQLHTIRQTQAERPESSANDFGLHLALYQDRERSRRRLFWGSHFIGLVFLLLGLVGMAAMFVYFFFSKPVGAFKMNSWDDVAFLAAASATVLCAWSIYSSWRKHEKDQSVFAPTLRQEIDRGIAHIDFEIFSDSSATAWRNTALVCLAGTLMAWELGRLSGDPLPWNILWMSVVLVAGMFVTMVPESRQALMESLRRKRVLEGLSAQLDENLASS